MKHFATWTLAATIFSCSMTATAFANSAWLPPLGTTELSTFFLYETFDSFVADGTEGAMGESAAIMSAGVSAQHGLCEDLALDLWVGYSVGSLGTDERGGLSDTRLGLRYRVLDEFRSDDAVPTVSLRLGLVAPGAYTATGKSMIAPGDGAWAGEISVLFGKAWVDSGFGVYGDAGFRARLGTTEFDDPEQSVPHQMFASLGVYSALPADLYASLAIRHENTLGGGEISGVQHFSGLSKRTESLELGFGGAVAEGHSLNLHFGYVLAGKNVAKKIVGGLGYTFSFGGEGAL